MGNHCPDCERDLVWDNGTYRCESCEKSFVKQAFCATCDELLEKLQACGATSYFCNSCNELKSKSSARIVFEEQKTVS
ncbi:zinc ribbon domain-containing protein [Grimontia kaedaensis]|uniref:Zinc ribbon domain-containing protein n=1 Tax=Grimontia kaedaensis TaxID=2872157 RepID=A0ABY4WQJ4_9GAMM|nr:zinc ribbon domain-containing protein [Grimontia kaedaensis]USH01868.1 zinc ribbon domain-containing protein [Grimontia kaedaensis]